MSRRRSYPPADPDRRAWLLSVGVPDNLVDQVESSRVPDTLLTNYQFGPGDFGNLTYMFNVLDATEDQVEEYLAARLDTDEIEEMLKAGIPVGAAAYLARTIDCHGWEYLAEEARAVEIDDWYDVMVVCALGREFDEDTADWLYGERAYAADPIPSLELFSRAGLNPGEAAALLTSGQSNTVVRAQLETLVSLRGASARGWGYVLEADDAAAR